MGVTTSGGSTIYPFGYNRPNDGQTIVQAGWENVNAGTAVYTVPAGKTFYLLGFNCTNGAAGQIGITATGINFRGQVAATTPFTVSSSVPIGKVDAGNAIAVLGYINGNYGCLWGFLE